MSKIKTFLTDSQPGYVLTMFFKFWLNLSLNVLIKKVLTKKVYLSELKLKLEASNYVWTVDFRFLQNGDVIKIPR